jgi:hypothetical protein
MLVPQKLLHLINRHQPGIEHNRRDGVPEKVRIDAFLDASGAGALSDIDCTTRVLREWHEV